MTTHYANLIRQAHAASAFGSFRELLCSTDGFRLTTPSPLQLAICAIIDGAPLGDLWDDPSVRAAFGGVKPITRRRWEEILILSGIRTGKSLIAGAAAVWATQKCGFTPAQGLTLGPGEVPRVSVLSVKRDLADVVFNHIIGNMQASPVLSSLILEEPTSDGLLVKHPNGRPVEIKVVAGSRAGSSLVARWSAGVVFDEAPRMQGEEDGVVNLDDARKAVRFRLLSEARLWYIGSPWAPSGPTYDMREENWGKPGAKVLVVKAPAPAMNPVYWTASRVAERRAEDPELSRTEIDAEFASPNATLFQPELVQRCVRQEPPQLPYEEGQTYVAAMDPATRANAWVLTLVTRAEGKIKQVGMWEWNPEPGQPLSPVEVMRQIADICAIYKPTVLKSDQWSADSLADIAQDLGIPFLQEDFHGTELARRYLGLARRMEAGMVELCPDPRVFRDLVAVRRKAAPGGGVKILLPITRDGRHTDSAPPLVMAAAEYMDDPVPLVVAAEKTEADQLEEQEDAEADWIARLASGDSEAADEFDLWGAEPEWD